MSRYAVDFWFSVCAMGAALIIAIACADKAKELDELTRREIELERSVSLMQRDIEELQARCLEAVEANELKDAQ